MHAGGVPLPAALQPILNALGQGRGGGAAGRQPEEEEEEGSELSDEEGSGYEDEGLSEEEGLSEDENLSEGDAAAADLLPPAVRRAA